MGMRLNPITKQWEDDGIPEDPAAAPTAPSTGVLPPPSMAGGGGAAPASAPGVTVQVGSPKPERSVTTGSEQRIESEGSRRAAGQAAAAGGAVLNASEQQANVDIAEGGVMAGFHGDKEEILRREAEAKARAEEERKRSVEQAVAADRESAAKEAAAGVKARRARLDYWKGNTAGEIFANFLRGIDRAASSFRGETGPTGVDRILDAKMDAHERYLVGEWEATKEARALKKKDAEAYQNELEKRKIEAARQSQAELGVLMARTDKYIAQLSPEKAAAAKAQRDAMFLLGEAKAEQARQSAYERTSRFSETRNYASPDQQQKPLATASTEDVDKLTKSQGAADKLEELADLVEKNPESWKNYQSADARQTRNEKILGSVPVAGKALLGLGDAVDEALGIGGPTVEAKLVSKGDKAGAGIARGIDMAASLIAKGNDPSSAVTESDLALARKQMGTLSQDAKSFAKMLRERAKAEREKSAAYQQVKSFGPAGTAVRERLAR